MQTFAGTAAPAFCARCGASFECGMGKPTPCWCSTEFSPLAEIPDAGLGCLCRVCLQREIAAQRTKHPT
ncbi:MAG: cysteine-rich CWC family protein [Burkholderiales bacterium]